MCLQPVAVILCPGWEKVQTVLELLEDSKATHGLHPTSVLLGVDQDEPKKFKIQKNCECVWWTLTSMLFVFFLLWKSVALFQSSDAD